MLEDIIRSLIVSQQYDFFTKQADALEKGSLLGELWPFYEQIDISKFNPEKSPPECSAVQCNIYQTCDTGKILKAKEKMSDIFSDIKKTQNGEHYHVWPGLKKLQEDFCKFMKMAQNMPSQKITNERVNFSIIFNKKPCKGKLHFF